MNAAKLEDESLVENIKKDVSSNECLEELVNRHSGIFYKATSLCLGDGQIKKDFLDDKFLFFMETVSKFDTSNEKKCKFSSFLFHRTRWECKRKLTKLNSKYQENAYDPSDFDFLIDYNDDTAHKNNPVKEVIFNEGLNQVEDALNGLEDKKAAEVIRMRYFEGEGKRPTPYIRIKDKVGLSRWGSVIAHDRGMKKIKNKINK